MAVLASTAVMFGLGALVVVPFAIVAFAKLGFSEAVALYANQWVSTFSSVAALGPVVGVLFCTLIFGGTALVRYSPGLAYWIRDHFGYLGAALAFVLMIIAAHQQTNRDAARLGLARTTGDPIDVPSRVETQRRSLSKLAETAASLVQALSAVEAELADSRRQLQSTLKALGEYDATIQSTDSSLREFSERQSLIEAQLGKMTEALGGQRPITVEDLNRSQWIGNLQGALFSLAVGLLYTQGRRRWARWRSRQRTNPQA
jgi:hypothetical protein